MLKALLIKRFYIYFELMSYVFHNLASNLKINLKNSRIILRLLYLILFYSVRCRVSLCTWYKILQIYINFPSDFFSPKIIPKSRILDEYEHLHPFVSQDTDTLQYSWPCCIGHTTSSIQLEFVYAIQHSRSYCK